MMGRLFLSCGHGATGAWGRKSLNMEAKGTGDHSFTWEEGKYAEKDEGNVGLHVVEHACRKKKKNSTTVGAFRCSSLATKMGLSTANIGLPLSPSNKERAPNLTSNGP